MNRSQKAENIKFLHAAFANSTLVLVAQYRGMTVAEMTDLRRRMRVAGAQLRVAKNRLAKLALQETLFQDVSRYLTGPTALAMSKDPVAAAKVAAAYAKENPKFIITGGSLGGRVVDVAGIEALSKLPSLDELRGKLLGLIGTPATRVATVLQAPAGQLARVFKAYSEKV
ncbi:MAG: 50S ribosomal protein L10 [Alphaproteobacteria bacterium]